MTLEIPLYQNKKRQMVPWEELTPDEKMEEKRKERIKTELLIKNEIKENKAELIELISAVTDVPKIEAQQEIERLLQEE